MYTSSPAGYASVRGLEALKFGVEGYTYIRPLQRERREEEPVRVGYKYTERAGSLSGQNLSNKKEGTEEENKTKQSVSENRLISWSDWSGLLCRRPLPASSPRSAPSLSPSRKIVTALNFIRNTHGQLRESSEYRVYWLINGCYEIQYIKLSIFLKDCSTNKCIKDVPIYFLSPFVYTIYILYIRELYLYVLCRIYILCSIFH